VRLRTAPALIPVLLALCVAAAPAGAAAPGHLDRGFGRSGIATAGAPKRYDRINAFTVAADGRVYVLDGPLLLAFGEDGKLAHDFGDGGRITIASARGGRPVGLAIDSRGRLLVTGSTRRREGKGSRAFVIRFLADGSRDPSFGRDGEVDAGFGLPDAVGGEGASVLSSAIVVDRQDRPVVGGSFGELNETCPYFKPGQAPFVARLTASGAVDESFAEAGHAVLEGSGAVESLAPIPAGGFAAFRRSCSTPPRFEATAPTYRVFGEEGETSPLATRGGLFFTYTAPAIDPSGRVVELESPSPAAEGPDGLVRLLPNGEMDPSFGNHGRVTLHHGLRRLDAFAVDSRGRPIIAPESRGVVLWRLLPDGRIDKGFGPGGPLRAKGPEPSAIALDANGRIYTLGLTQGSSRTVVRIARFVPGP
jgi:uncharacterized delta-60 repeat protein